MKLVIIVLVLITITERSQAIDWFCLKNFKYRPMLSIDCSEKGKGVAFCDSKKGKKRRCGKFNTKSGRIIVAPSKGAAAINLGPVSIRPETVSSVRSSRSETTGFFGKRATKKSASLLKVRYPPRTNAFSESRKRADSYTNKEWLNTSMIDRAKYIYSVGQALIQAHGKAIPSSITPAVLTCKALRESCFKPQATAAGRASSAAGLSQATRSSIGDLFNRGKWFRSKVPGFENLRTSSAYYSNMARSMPAQIEIGLGILRQKGIDHKTTSIVSMLRNYYGNRPSLNASYARHINSCAQCINSGNEALTTSCLRKSRRNCFP